MAEKVKSPATHLYTRVCVQCGSSTPSLQHNSTTQCEHCGCDLRARPPRSYAEMEGLLYQRRPSIPPIREDVLEPQRLILRWLAILFLFFIGLVSVVFLAAAMSV